jgi:RNA polymerase sigma factor (sigma-70 family)
VTNQVKSLLGACLNGEKSSWDAFVLQYTRLVYYTIKKTLSLYHVEPSTDIVDDMFQNFFLSLIRDDFRKLLQFRGRRDASLACWLRVIAARQTIDYLRKREASASCTTDNFAPDNSDPSASLMDQEQKRLLSQTLEALTPRDRLFVELYFYQSFPPEEIAKILQVSTSAVYTKKSRVLTKLRESLNHTEAL